MVKGLGQYPYLMKISAPCLVSLCIFYSISITGGEVIVNINQIIKYHLIDNSYTKTLAKKNIKDQNNPE